MNEFKIGDKIKYEICIDDNNTKWMYGTINNITPYEEDINEENYEVLLENGEIEFLSIDDFQYMFENNIDEDVECLLDTINKNSEINKLLSCFNDNEELKKALKETLKEALTKVDDSRRVKRMKINPLGTEDILDVKKIEIEGDYGAFDVWYTCEDGSVHQDLQVNTINEPNSLKSLEKQISNVDADDLFYKFKYEIEL